MKKIAYTSFTLLCILGALLIYHSEWNAPSGYSGEYWESTKAFTLISNYILGSILLISGLNGFTKILINGIKNKN